MEGGCPSPGESPVLPRLNGTLEQSFGNQAAVLQAQCQEASGYMPTQAFRDLEPHEQANFQQRLQVGGLLRLKPRGSLYCRDPGAAAAFARAAAQLATRKDFRKEVEGSGQHRRGTSGIFLHF